MSDKMQVSGHLIAAAQALTGSSQIDFAAAAGLPVETLRLIEESDSAWVQPRSAAEALHRGLEHFGLIVIDESDGMGAGVRLNSLGRMCARSLAWKARAGSRGLMTPRERHFIDQRLQ